MSDRKEHDNREDVLQDDVLNQEIPDGVDRRTFLMRSAVVGSAAVISGVTLSAQERAHQAPPGKKTQGPAPTPPLDPTLDVVKKSKGPVMTTLDEFYKVGPGP